MISIKIRDARHQDLRTLLAFEQGVIQAERPFDPTLANDPISYYNLKEFISRKDVKVIVALVEGEIVGSGYALLKNAKSYFKHKQYSYLGFMFTKPGFRGNGVNAKIIDELKNWSSKQGVDEIRLTVYDDNSSAIKAYEKAGFKKHMIEMRLK